MIDSKRLFTIQGAFSFCMMSTGPGSSTSYLSHSLAPLATLTAPIIYTAKEDGVLPAYNIRTDRFDIAMNAYDKITRNSAKKDIAPKPEDFGNVPNKTDGGSPSEN